MSTARILDANANRAREALRVLEDAARFVLDDATLTEACKTLRHDVTAVAAPLCDLSSDRNTAGDVGTGLTTTGEMQRQSTHDVIVAAGKRLGEALRSLEEYAKTTDGDAAARFKQLRYRGYELEQRFATTLADEQAQQWKLCLLLTAELCPDSDWRRVATAALAGGCDCIQLREKNLDDRRLLERAIELRSMTQGRAALIINDRADIAMLAGADGVHLGQDDLPITTVRKLYGRAMFVGVSTHNIQELDSAVRSGADYVGLGAMFRSTTKPDRAPAGPAFLDVARERHPQLPHLAIGGVTAENVSQLVARGCRGVAVSTAICQADDPQAVTQRIVEHLAEACVS